MIPANVIRQIEAIVGPEHLLTSPEDCWTYAYDATDQAQAPEAVVFPGSAAEICANSADWPMSTALPSPPGGRAPAAAAAPCPLRAGWCWS